jgi:hypothetical protein
MQDAKSHDAYLKDGRRPSFKQLCRAHHSTTRRTGKVFPEQNYHDLLPSLSMLASGSWLVRLQFELRTPFLSQSESDIPECDNGGHDITNFPHRDRLSGLVEIKPSTWKGNLRAAAGETSDFADTDIGCLFGTKETAGALVFFPTFFSEGDICTEVVTPLNGLTGRPRRGPIKLLCVPKGSKGELLLAFTPRGNDSARHFPKYFRNTLSAAKTMMTITGFSSRGSKGWGRTNQRINATVALKGYRLPSRGSESDYSRFLENDGTVKSIYTRNNGKLLGKGQFNKRKDKGMIPADVTRTAFEKFKAWYKKKSKQRAIRPRECPEGLNCWGPGKLETLLKMAEGLEYAADNR